MYVLMFNVSKTMFKGLRTIPLIIVLCMQSEDCLYRIHYEVAFTSTLPSCLWEEGYEDEALRKLTCDFFP